MRGGTAARQQGRAFAVQAIVVSAALFFFFKRSLMLGSRHEQKKSRNNTDEKSSVMLRQLSLMGLHFEGGEEALSGVSASLERMKKRLRRSRRRRGG